MYVIKISLVSLMVWAGFGLPVYAQDGDAETRYKQTCIVCHGEGMHGAPKLGIKSDWEERLSYGIEDVYLNTIEGMGNVMPARGMCADCTDEQIEAIVDYMVKDLK